MPSEGVSAAEKTGVPREGISVAEKTGVPSDGVPAAEKTGVPSEGVYVPQGRSYFRDIPLPRPDGMEGQHFKLEKTRHGILSGSFPGTLKNTEGTSTLLLCPHAQLEQL